MKIKFWGVRGSLPSSLNPQEWGQHFESLMNQFFTEGYSQKTDISTFIKKTPLELIGGFGTATSCVEVTSADKKSIIIDGGSGLRTLSDQMIKLKNDEMISDEFHILMTHFHFDHILGLPFFTPHFTKGKKIHYYTIQNDAEEIIRQMFKRPIFPVGFEHLEADIYFHKIEPYKKNLINGFEVKAYLMDHPDPCYGFRIEKDGQVYAHAVDNEAIRTTKAQLGFDSGLFEQANLLFFDAQYEEADMISRKGWGHGTCDRGFEIAHNFGVQQILFAHHDPSFSIQDSWNQKKKAMISYEKKFPSLKLKWDFAVEGQTVQL
jgi:phosphoribosyl 1,2-cyclic phosphodiesterase